MRRLGRIIDLRRRERRSETGTKDMAALRKLELEHVPVADEDRRTWHDLLRWTLRTAVGVATLINGAPITAALLQKEKRLVSSLFEKIQMLTDEHVDAVERVLQTRLSVVPNAYKVMVDRAAGHLRLLGVPPSQDLGAMNTHALVALFTEYPFSTLTRCKQCQQLFVPVGRVRTRGVEFCSDSCKRSLENVRRRVQ